MTIIEVVIMHFNVADYVSVTDFYTMAVFSSAEHENEKGIK